MLLTFHFLKKNIRNAKFSEFEVYVSLMGTYGIIEVIKTNGKPEYKITLDDTLVKFLKMEEEFYHDIYGVIKFLQTVNKMLKESSQSIFSYYVTYIKSEHTKELIDFMRSVEDISDEAEINDLSSFDIFRKYNGQIVAIDSKSDYENEYIHPSKNKL